MVYCVVHWVLCIVEQEQPNIVDMFFHVIDLFLFSHVCIPIPFDLSVVLWVFVLCEVDVHSFRCIFLSMLSLDIAVAHSG